MEVEKRKQIVSMLISISVFVCIMSVWKVVDCQLPIPTKFDGFVYKGRGVHDDAILIEAFLDPVCPVSRESWPPLKQAFDHYGHRLSLIIHIFPLPYHDSSFSASRALHIVNRVNASVTYEALETLFQNQEKFYNKEVYKKSKQSTDHLIAKLVAKVLGNNSLSVIESGFEDKQTELAARFSFKYGCSRGVIVTPSFFVNGFQLPNAGSAVDFEGWRNIIDPLVEVRGQREDIPHYFQ
nr:TPA_asm: hypothetical protein HUJ06_016030 [Nelumbo nucifera]